MTDLRNERDNGVSNDLTLSLLGLPFAFGVSADRAVQVPSAQGLVGRQGDVADGYEDARSRRLVVKTLALIRRAMNISQSDMARRMGTSQSAISEIEKGLKDPRLSTLQRMARALEVELHVSISFGSWLLQAWTRRNISYDSSVRPTRIEEGLEDLWMTMLAERKRDPLRVVVSTEKSNVRPITSRDPRDDSYANVRDVFGASVIDIADVERAS